MAKLITLDIETSTRVGLFFGNQHKAHIAKVVQEMYVFGFSWKPLNGRVKSCYMWDFPLYKKDPTNDIEVIKKWIEVASEADIIVGQNSRKFDDKVMLGRAIMHNLPPPTPFATIDTMAETAGVARYDEKGLDYVSKQYGHGGKVATGGIDLWWECLDIPGFKKGNAKAQKKMVKYCENDVIKTEKKYLRERPYYKRHPALNVIDDRPKSCPKCGGDNFQARGYTHTKTNRYHKFQCQSCYGWVTSRTPEARLPDNKMMYV